MSRQTVFTSDPDPLDAAASQIVAAHGGDIFNALKAMISENQTLEAELRRLQAAGALVTAAGASTSCRLIGRTGTTDMSSLEFIRTEIERLRVQISRQQQDILRQQRLGQSTGLSEVVLERMRASVEGLCAKRDGMQAESRIAAVN